MTTFRTRQEVPFVLENAGWPALLIEHGHVELYRVDASTEGLRFRGRQLLRRRKGDE